MKKKLLIETTNLLLKTIWADENKSKQLIEICTELKVNTSYNGRVLANVKANSTIKDLELLINCIEFVLK